MGNWYLHEKPPAWYVCLREVISVSSWLSVALPQSASSCHVSCWWSAGKHSFHMTMNHSFWQEDRATTYKADAWTTHMPQTEQKHTFQSQCGRLQRKDEAERRVCLFTPAKNHLGYRLRFQKLHERILLGMQWLPAHILSLPDTGMTSVGVQ